MRKIFLMAMAVMFALASVAAAEPIDDWRADSRKAMVQTKKEYAKAERLCKTKECKEGIIAVRKSFDKMKADLLEAAEEVMTLVTGERDGLIIELDAEMAKAQIAFLKTAAKGGKAYDKKLKAEPASLCDSGKLKHDNECRKLMQAVANDAAAGRSATRTLGDPFRDAEKRHAEALDHIFNAYVDFLRMILEQKGWRFSDED